MSTEPIGQLNDENETEVSVSHGMICIVQTHGVLDGSLQQINVYPADIVAFCGLLRRAVPVAVGRGARRDRGAPRHRAGGGLAPVRRLARRKSRLVEPSMSEPEDRLLDSDLDPRFMDPDDARWLKKIQELRRRAGEWHAADPEDVRIAEILTTAARWETELRNAYAEPQE